METMRKPTMFGACQTAQLESIAKFGHGLTPGRYVAVANVGGDGVSLEETFDGLQEFLSSQIDISHQKSEQIRPIINMVPRNV